MKVVITDYTFPDVSLEQSILASYGGTVTAGQCRTVDELMALVADADAIITQFAPIREPVVAAMRQARVIVRYGIGVDNVDLAAAQRRSIPVCNVPDYCIDEVADQTLAFILSATRSVVANHRQVQQGAWGLGVPLARMRTLKEMTVGVVGFGRIGREVVARLKPFKCRVVVFDPAIAAAAIQAAQAEPVTLAELLTQADVVTLHCPSTPETHHLLNAQNIARLRSGAIVVNVGRGDLIETAALVEALQSGHISVAALDVFEQEPLPSDSPLRTFDSVILASHIASASVNAVRTLRETAAHLAGRALSGQPLPNVVNGVGV